MRISDWSSDVCSSDLWDARVSVTDMVNEGVRRAYNHPDNKLRASVLADPAGKRTNTRDSTPAVIHYEIVQGEHVEVICAAKGGGSEAKTTLAIDRKTGV